MDTSSELSRGLADALLSPTSVQRGGGRIEKRFSLLLDASSDGASRDLGYDYLTTDEEGVPSAIILKIVRQESFAKNWRNLASALLAASVQARRALGSAAAVKAAILVAGPPDSIRENFSQNLRLLSDHVIRGDDSVGFDTICVATPAGRSELVWELFWPSSSPALARSVSTRTFHTEYAIELFKEYPQVALAPAIRPRSNARQNFLLVADELISGRGGISTINRELALALIAAGKEVVIALPRVSDVDARLATELGVLVAAPAQVPGLSERETLLLRPIFAEPDWEPDVVIGHGRLLGPYAAALRDQFFPQAHRVHVVHTDSEQLESAKEATGGESRMISGADRAAVEIALASSADLILAVGPLLADSIADDLLGHQKRPVVVCLVPGLRDGMDVVGKESPVRNRILFVGRADDFESKGLNLLAEALRDIVDRWHGDEYRPELIIRGVPDFAADDVKRRLDDRFEGHVKYTLRPYNSDEAALARDFAQSRVVVMPSLHEGFGLAAWEAIAAGVPVLISDESGVARFLRQNRIDTARGVVVPVRDDGQDSAVGYWRAAVEWILTNPERARQEAVQLRQDLRAIVSWPRATQNFLDQLP